ncbi:MAG: sugar phosphate isomerase/epimerase [Proteobacteria bacterium]|nr:sugar phosphate isomerase/epimerase [Pseudomonadota bacterium]
MPIFINVPYKMVEANIKRIVEFNMGIEIYANNDVVDDLDMEGVRELSKILQDSGIVCTVHAPYMDLSPGGFDKTIKAISRDKIKKSVEMANTLHAKCIVCHPGYDKWRFGDNEQLWFDSSIETWTEILKEADDGLIVALENIFEETPSTFIALFHHFKDKNLFFCFDSGHFNLFTTVSLERWLTPLKDRIREMHLHDNHGSTDEHLPIGRGTFPFRELKAFLSQANGNIIYTAEIASESHVAESIKNAKEFLT